MTETTKYWELCPDCGRSFLGHQVRGLIAYCSHIGGLQAPWPKWKVYGWRLDVGYANSPNLAAAAARDAVSDGATPVWLISPPEESS